MTAGSSALIASTSTAALREVIPADAGNASAIRIRAGRQSRLRARSLSERARARIHLRRDLRLRVRLSGPASHRPAV